jgi:hypothetical protein
MNAKEVGLKLVELCRKGEFMQAVDSLYGDDIVSVEPEAMGSMPAEMRGLDQVRSKTHWWLANHELHDSKVSGPFAAGEKFVVRFDIDATDKTSSQRRQMSEVAIYTVRDGKVAREEFLPLARGEA